MAQAGAEAAVGHDAARLRVILHVIRIIVCNNDVRPRAADNVRHRVHDSQVMTVDQHIPDIQVERLLCADNLRCLFKFLRAHRRQRLRLNDHMALIAVRHMAGVDLRALLDIFPKRTPQAISRSSGWQPTANTLMIVPSFLNMHVLPDSLYIQHTARELFCPLK